MEITKDFFLLEFTEMGLKPSFYRKNLLNLTNYTRINLNLLDLYNHKGFGIYFSVCGKVIVKESLLVLQSK